MALSYIRPSLFCEPTSVCSVWVWAHLLRCILSAFVYTETQNTTGVLLGNRKPHFLFTPLFLPVFPGWPPRHHPTRPGGRKNGGTALTINSYQKQMGRYRIYPCENMRKHMWSNKQSNSGAFLGTGPWHSPEDWGPDTIPFAGSVRALLSGMRWDSIRLERIWADKLINEYNEMAQWVCSFVQDWQDQTAPLKKEWVLINERWISKMGKDNE